MRSACSAQKQDRPQLNTSSYVLKDTILLIARPDSCTFKPLADRAASYYMHPLFANLCIAYNSANQYTRSLALLSLSLSDRRTFPYEKQSYLELRPTPSFVRQMMRSNISHQRDSLAYWEQHICSNALSCKHKARYATPSARGGVSE